MDDLHTELRRYRSDHPGHPLGPGAPLGVTLRLDGESHRQAWMRLLRADPCAYCGRSLAELPVEQRTVDHIVPQDPLASTPALGGKYSWLNLTASCSACNGSKGNQSVITFLRLRAVASCSKRRTDRREVAYTGDRTEHMALAAGVGGRRSAA